MTRIYVDTEADDYSEQTPSRRYYFVMESADYWHGNQDFNGSNLEDINTRDDARGQGLYLTAQGRWVLRRWSNWQGEADVHTYLPEDEARDWLIFNSYDHVVSKYFDGSIEEERGPGRPSVGGGDLTVKFGLLKGPLDAYAVKNGISTSEAVRRFVRSCLQQVAQ